MQRRLGLRWAAAAAVGMGGGVLGAAGRVLAAPEGTAGAAGAADPAAPGPAASADATPPPRLAEADLAFARTLRTAGLADTRALALVQRLTQQVGARPAGSPADARAVAWALAEARALGLPRVWQQPVPLRVWRRGPAQATLVAPERRTLVMAALGNSVGTPPGGLEAELAWYADFQALKDDRSERARGRIVFIDQRMDRSRDGSGYGRAVPARFGSAAEAARRGALAVVIRSVGTSGANPVLPGEPERVAHTGAMRYDDDAAQIPALAVSVADADHLAALQAAGQPLRLALQVASQVGVEALSHNVLAELPGQGALAHEVVLLGAHLDSWDVGEGAVDDGAGVGIVLAALGLIAERLRAAPADLAQAPRRSLRLALYANEENGFDGALAYSRAHGAETHQWVSESDFGAGAAYAWRHRVRPEALPVMAQIAAELAPLGLPLADGNDATPGPDAAVLMRRHRWPAVQLHQDGSSYFDVHHTPHDTFARLDGSALPQNVAAWAVLAWLAARAPVAFGPLPAR